MADIGEPLKEVEFEPFPETTPVPAPVEEPVVPVPVEEPVPV